MPRLLCAALLALLPAAAPAIDITVDQQRMAFHPDSVTLHVGDVLVFQNSDRVNHNVQVVGADADTVDIGLQRPGQSVSHAFDRAGAYEVRCTVHPDMMLTVTVK
jgi:plastocyanin